MNKIKRALGFWASRNLSRKFPRESSLLFRKLVLEPSAITAEDITSFTKLHNFDDVWIFHGIAMKHCDNAFVLAGPQGIGKSSLLRTILRAGIAEPIDDGFILVCKAGESYYVLNSGLYPMMKTISVISTWLKTLLRYQSPYLDGGHQYVTAETMKRGEILHNLAVLIGSIVTKNRRSERAISAPVKLRKLFLVGHPHDLYPPRRIRGETIETPDTGNIERIFNYYSSCEVIHSYMDGLRKILYDGMLAELRKF